MKLKKEKDRMRETLSEKYTSQLIQESNLVDRLIEKTERLDSEIVVPLSPQVKTSLIETRTFWSGYI